jgi:hypothetical protein
MLLRKTTAAIGSVSSLPVVLLCLFSSTPSARAQTTTSEEITGTVTDSSGVVVAGAI